VGVIRICVRLNYPPLSRGAAIADDFEVHDPNGVMRTLPAPLHRLDDRRHRRDWPRLRRQRASHRGSDWPGTQAASSVQSICRFYGESGYAFWPSAKHLRCPKRRLCVSLPESINPLMHRIASEQRGIGANWRFARLVAPSAARSQANQAAAGADFDHLRTKAEAEGLDGGWRSQMRTALQL